MSRKNIELRNEQARVYLLGGEEPPEDLLRLNLGELTELSRHAGVPCDRGVGRDAVVEALEDDTPPCRSKVDAVRDRMIRFVKLYWHHIQHQLPEDCLSGCYDCSDAKVLHCYVENKRKNNPI